MPRPGFEPGLFWRSVASCHCARNCSRVKSLQYAAARVRCDGQTLGSLLVAKLLFVLKSSCHVALGLVTSWQVTSLREGNGGDSHLGYSVV
jgi:hypothetical protein